MCSELWREPGQAAEPRGRSCLVLLPLGISVQISPLRASSFHNNLPKVHGCAALQSRTGVCYWWGTFLYFFTRCFCVFWLFQNPPWPVEVFPRGLLLPSPGILLVISAPACPLCLWDWFLSSFPAQLLLPIPLSAQGLHLRRFQPGTAQQQY